MRISEITESLADYGNEWVHFTKHPMLTINPQQFHSDPAGIYFFPASINPDAEMWRTMPYKFTATVSPDSHILDVSQITPEQIYQMIDAIGVRDKFDAYLQQYPPKDHVKMFDMAWEQLQRFYSYEGPKLKQYASFNSMLRGLGWQGIFDDTGSIHVGERQQLLVLDPRILQNVQMEQKSGSGFNEVQQIVQQVSAMCQQYGHVEVGKLQKPGRDAGYADRENLLMCTIVVTNPQNPDANYAWISIKIGKQFPDRVSVSIRYSRPSLGYGSGVELSLSTGKPVMGKGIEALNQDLTKIFTPQSAAQPAPTAPVQPQQQPAQQPVQQPAVAETRKVPGPRLVGSGKDFRQKAGTNRSGKQPGNLAGSGKPMKAKPGFVGGG